MGAGFTKYDVKGLRRRLGLTQGELAKAIPTTERSVRRWEKERITPQNIFITRMKELEDAKFGEQGGQVGSSTAETASGAMTRPHRRKLPPPEDGLPDEPSRPLGIMPSSM